ncbi:NAD-dependent epimerase/dehydratase family protein [Psychrobacillus glaciei]|uniref:NAD-dependent epimerase/dehydratase family protein n=1 Tax=Psychrobacillus glaciei TaxID=2283160 RepID=A0A5J6SMX1_9BACI|nr:NAD(P)H-binding protein [Psychrobacillus glaciei]QFF99281.1 NAD-dependent epimerase/dehydratase family protein [Psychrobacillus glaciei]
MNITVFGANGQIGQHFVNVALQNGNKVKAIVRREGALEATHPNLEVVVINYNDVSQVTATIQGQDAVVSKLGASLSMSRKVKDLPITKAHETILRVMEQQGVKRFITLGTPSIKSAFDQKQLVTVMPSIMAKLMFPTGFAEMNAISQLIHQSQVDWTVIRIVNPNTNKDGKGYAISLGDTKGKFTVSHKNVAKCMYDAIRKQECIGKMPIVFNK